jgi:hypothetical protein
MNQYWLLQENSSQDLEDRIERAMAVGWKCQGGVMIVSDSISGQLYFYQAMVR